MKTKTLILSVLICALSKAQITLENAYPATAQYQNMQVIELVKSGYKYQLNNNNIVKLYNLNHSIFKSITLPVPVGFNVVVAGASDSLFNTDNLIEVAYYYYAYTSTVTPATFTYETKVVDENGSTIITIPQGTYPQIVYTGKANGYKMIVNVDSTNKNTLKQINVYSLVGGLPMHSQTPTNGNITNLVEYTNTNIITGAIPNPSANKTTIGYQLPLGESFGEITLFDINGKELKHYQVDGNFSTLELDNSELASGTYIYQLTTAGGKSSAKKMVVVK